MTTPADDELLDAWLDGSLEASQIRILAARLQSEPELRRRLVQRARSEALLATAAGGGWTEVRNPHLSLPHRRRWAYAAAALLLAVIGLAWLGVTLAKTGDRIDILSGELLSEAGRPVVPRLDVIFRTADTTPARLRLPDGSVVDLDARTRARITGRRPEQNLRHEVSLYEGGGRFSVSRNDGLFRVAADHAVVTVLGTEFSVRYQGEKRRTVAVEVSRGRISVLHDNRPVEMSAGESRSFAGGGNRTVRARVRKFAGQERQQVLFVSGEERGNRWQLAVENQSIPVEGEGVPASLADLRENQEVLLAIDADDALVKVTVLPPNDEMVLVACDQEKRRLTLSRSKEREGKSTAAYPLAADAVITLGGRSIGLDDLAPGQRLRIGFDAARTVINRVMVVAGQHRSDGEKN